MPIDLTTVPEGSRPHRPGSHRRRSHRNKARLHMQLAIGGGFLALGILASILIFSQSSFRPTPVTNAYYDSGFQTGTPRDPVPLEKSGAPPMVTSSPAVSSGELAPEKTMAKLISLARIRSTETSDSLQLQYEFFQATKTPSSYIIVIRMPGNGGVTYASFGTNAPVKDTVILPVALSRIGNHGPISLWIETVVPKDERVSNILTIQ